MKRLLIAAALAPLSFAAAHAGTITGADTGTHTTSAEGDITINAGASVTPPTSATAGTVAITINSNNSVDDEGAITVTETTTGLTTNQGIAQGPFANGGNRTGILVSGAGPFTGDITVGSSGAITVVGENSAGIDVETGLNGFLSTAGTITVTGGDLGTADVTYGIFQASNAPISGNVSIAGTISANGGNATGVALNGNIGGSLDIHGAITATGFRSTTAPVTPSVLAALTPDQLEIGGPALSIGGSIAGGVTLDAPVAASGNIAATTGGTLSVFGSAPALLIGGAQPITIGAGADGYGVTLGGTIQASGAYPDVSATGVLIGGVNPLGVTSGGVAPGGNFSSVTLTGGLLVSGTISATATAHTPGAGAATGLEIGQGATIPLITVTGGISAFGSNTLDASNQATPPGATTAILIDPGATVGGTTLNISGSLTAEVTGVAGIPGVTESAGGIVGNAIVIDDAGGALSQIVNTGSITATIVSAVAGVTPVGGAIAILENNTAPITVTQCSAVDSSGDCVSTGNATLAPSITGDILFVGTGAATLNLWGGAINGAISFGNSTGNVFDIENGGRARGALAVASGGQLALNVNNGQLFMTSPSVVPLSSLHIGATGSVVFTGDPLDPTASLFSVSGNATLDSGAEVGLTLDAPLANVTTFTVIQTAGNLTAGNISSALLGQIPFLENGAISTTPNSLSITVAPKTAAELRLNPAETAEFPAVNAAIGSDSEVAADLLSKLDRPSLIHVLDQFLPDYAGGPFETLVAGQQEIARAQAETPVKMQTDTVRGWVQEIGYLDHQSTTTEVNGYQGLGFGVAGGLESSRGDNAIGVTAAFLATGVQDQTQPSDQSLTATAFELGVYWRKGAGQKGLIADAGLNAGLVTFGSHRFLIDQTDSNDLQQTPSEIISREAKASWIGAILSANVAVGYQISMGRFYARPEVSADYELLSQQGYTERGGGPAFNLKVAPQTSSQADAQADLVLGMNFGQAIQWRPEVTVGYRAVVSGGPSSTTASFLGGQSFTINPSFTDKGGFLARLGVRASGPYADFSADAGGEFRAGYQTYNARAAARFLF